MVKSRDRYAILFGSLLVAITFLLVLDIQSGLNFSRANLLISESDGTDTLEQRIQSGLHNEEEDKSLNSDGVATEQTEKIDIFAALKWRIGHQ